MKNLILYHSFMCLLFIGFSFYNCSNSVKEKETFTNIDKDLSYSYNLIKKDSTVFESASSLNDSAIYTINIDKNGLRTKLNVWKYKYRNDRFLVELENDSLNSGHEFQINFLFLNGVKDSAMIKIKDSFGKQLVFNKTDIKESRFVFKSKNYIKGVNQITGIIQNGKQSMVFSYNYFVR